MPGIVYFWLALVGPKLFVNTKFTRPAAEILSLSVTEEKEHTESVSVR